MISEGADIVEICCTPPQPGHPVATPPTIGTGSPHQAHEVAGVAEALAGDVRVAIATGSPELAAAAVTAGATLICDRSMVPSTVGGRAAEQPAAAEAARTAKRYVEEGLRHPPGIGHGNGPLSHRNLPDKA